MFRLSMLLARNPRPDASTGSRLRPVLLSMVFVLAVGAVATVRAWGPLLDDVYNSIPMITVGGTGGTGTATVDPTAYEGGGGTSTITTGKATVVNNTGGPIHDCTVALKKVGTPGGKPSFSSASVGTTTANASVTSSGSTAHITGLNLPSGTPPPSFELTLSGINMGNCEGASVSVTSSTKTVVDDVEVEASRVGSYGLSPLADSLRLGIEDVANAAIFADVVNTDAQSDITAISGSFFPADGTSTSLVSVHLHHMSSGAPVSGAVGSVDGDDFSIAGFAPLPQDARVRLVAILSDTPGYERLTRLQVEASFD